MNLAEYDIGHDQLVGNDIDVLPAMKQSYHSRVTPI